MDFFTVPTATVRVLYVFFVIHHARDPRKSSSRDPNWILARNTLVNRGELSLTLYSPRCFRRARAASAQGSSPYARSLFTETTKTLPFTTSGTLYLAACASSASRVPAWSLL